MQEVKKIVDCRGMKTVRNGSLADLFDTSSLRSASGGILLKNSWLEKRTRMRVSYFEARSLKRNLSQLSYAIIFKNLVRKASEIVFQQYWEYSGHSDPKITVP